MATSNQSDFWDDVTQTAQKATENVKQAGQRAYDTIDNATGGAVSRAVDTVKQAGQRAYNTVNDATGGRLDKAVGAAQEFFENPDPFINPYHNNSGRFMRDVENAQAQRDNDDNTYTDRFGRKVPFEEGKYYRSGDNYFLWQDGKRVPADPNQRDNFRRQRDTEIDLENLDMNAERYNAEVAERDKHDKALKDIDNKYFKVRDNGDGTNDIIINDEDYEKRRYEQKRADRIYKSKQDSIRDRYNNPDDDITPYDEDFLKNPDFDRITNPILYTYKGRDGRYHSYEEGKTYRDADGNTFIWQNNRPVLKDQDITVNIDKAQRARYKKAQGSNTKTAGFVRYKILDNQEREGHVYGEKLKGGQTRLYRISGGERVYLDPDEYNRYGVEFQPK